MWLLALAFTVCVAGPTGATQRPLAEAEVAIEAAIDAGEIPGAVLLIGRGSSTPDYSVAFGRAGVVGAGGLMKTDTVFDLASLTKVVATATSVVKLIDQGRVVLDAPVAQYLPEFGAHGKQAITIEHLLTHRGGLIPDNALRDYDDGPELAWQRICALEPRAAAGTTFTYTDVGFIVLGKLIERVDGRPLDVFAQQEIFTPLGMLETTFNPGPELRLRCAPTEQRDGEWMRGQVHDPRAIRLSGVAGHAGLFSTAADLSRWCRMILGEGILVGTDSAQAVRVLSPEAVREMTRPRWLKDGSGGRGLGFDVATGYSSPRGKLFPRGSSFGHTGFTGTCFWLDPAAKGYFILLTNRVHPDGKGKVVGLRRLVADPIARYLGSAPGSEAGPLAGPLVGAVKAGVDVLQDSQCAQLAGKRLGLITNVTGRTRAGERTIDVLHRTEAAELVRIFSPEHGLYAKLEGQVGDATDEATGLPVFSLYGETRKLTPEMLEGLDAVVFDIQDVGARYYTYISTLGLALEACAENDVELVVLDRPNPLTGRRVEGPRIDDDRLSFIGWRPLPVTHGMTVGELAQMFRVEWGGIPCNLKVIEMQGWSRDMWWEETGLTWVNPSPNMRNPTQAVLYPCIGLLEGANLSVGRGTDEPFELFGAPWIDGPMLAAALHAADLPGLNFTPIEFTPDASKFKGELCHGVHVTVTDRDALRPVVAGLAIMWHLNRLFSSDFELAKMNARLRSRRIWEALVTTPNWRALAGLWAPDVAEFGAQRSAVPAV